MIYQEFRPTHALVTTVDCFDECTVQNPNIFTLLSLKTRKHSKSSNLEVMSCFMIRKLL